MTTFPDFFAQAQETVSKPLQNLMVQLADRWIDEAAYEDINDYAAAIRKALPAGVELTKMLKRPFGFRFTQDGHSFQLTSGQTTYTLKHLGTVAPAPKPTPAPEPAPAPVEPLPAPADPDGADNGDPFPGVASAADDCYVVIIHNDDWTVAELTAVPAKAARFARRMARKEWLAAGNSDDGIEFNARAAGPEHA